MSDSHNEQKINKENHVAIRKQKTECKLQHAMELDDYNKKNVKGKKNADFHCSEVP